MDVIQAGVTKLGDTRVPLKEAQTAAKLAEQVERQLWRWRRSVEASYLDRHGSVTDMAVAVSTQEEVALDIILAEMVKVGALTPSWWKLDLWARDHGVSVWPQLEEGAEDGD